MDPNDATRSLSWIFDPLRCDGPVMLSALTLLKSEGVAAIARIEKILSAIAGDDDSALAEWSAIREAAAAASQ
jgi:hypothetical protein